MCLSLVILPLLTEIVYSYPKDLGSPFVGTIHSDKTYRYQQMPLQKTLSTDDASKNTENLRLKYTEIGGILNLNDTYSYNSKENKLHVINNTASLANKPLSDSEKNNLREVIVTNNFFETACSLPNKVSPESISYKLTVTNNTNTHECTWTDNSSPDETSHLFNIVDTIKKIASS
jgi:hypothetical protein